MAWLERLGIALPVIQAPMAGVSTPALAAAVAEAGALGSIGVGAAGAAEARAMVAAVRERTARPFNVNLFVHGSAAADPAREQAWLAWLRPAFAEFGAEPPATLQPFVRNAAADAQMLEMLLEVAPPVVSFHFGLPPQGAIEALRGRGIVLMATATCLTEGRALEAAGIDVILAQGIEAGGHRGTFDPAAADAGLGVLPLTRLLVRHLGRPVVAAGGIMDGAGIAAALALGACAAQLGTAFVACPESAADAAYRAALRGPGAQNTVLTPLISGRPARGLANRFTALGAQLDGRLPPAYPLAYEAGRALHAAASARGEHGFAPHWAGQGALCTRPMPAAALVDTLRRELLWTRAALGAAPPRDAPG